MTDPLDESHRSAVSPADLPYIVGALAHELRGPLNAIAGWSQVVAHAKENGREIPDKALAGIFRAISEQTTQLDAMSTVSPETARDEATATEGRALRIDFGRCLQDALAQGDPRENTIRGVDSLSGLKWPQRAHLQPLARALVAHLRSVRLPIMLTVLARERRAPSLCIALVDQTVLPAALSALGGGVSLSLLRDKPRQLLACWRLRNAASAAGLSIQVDRDREVIIAPGR